MDFRIKGILILLVTFFFFNKVNAQRLSLRTGAGATVSINYFSDDRNKTDALTWFPGLSTAGELILRYTFKNNIFIETGRAKNGLTLTSQLIYDSFGSYDMHLCGLPEYNFPFHLGITTDLSKKWTFSQYIGTAYNSNQRGFLPASSSSSIDNGIITDYIEDRPIFHANHYWVFKTGTMLQYNFTQKNAVYLHLSYSQGFVKVLEQDIMYYLADGVHHTAKVATNGSHIAFQLGWHHLLFQPEKKNETNYSQF